MSIVNALKHEEAGQWEANLRTGQWVSCLGCVGGLLCFTTSARLGWVCSSLALCSLVWFSVVRRVRAPRLGRILRSATPGVALLIPSIILLGVAWSADLQTAFASWIPPLITFCLLLLSTGRLQPLRPVVYAAIAAALNAATYLFLTRHTSAAELAQFRQLVAIEQVQRLMYLLGSGVGLAMVTRGLRTRLRSVEQRARQNALFGKYRLGAPIASGGMATVVAAEYCPEGGFARPVAVKRIHPHLASHPEVVDSFRAEAELGARLAHPNIVAVLDFGKVDDTYFLAMEYVDGLDVGRLMKRLRQRRVCLPARLAGFIAHEILQGLVFAHSGARDRSGELLRVVHRDLSPNNVLIARTGDVKITDFGIACALKDSTRHHTERIIGSFSYLAPEQASQEPFDHRADLFAVGTLLHEMLTMNRLFKRETTAATLLAILQDEAPSVTSAQLSDSWDIFLDRALAKDPAARFPSARAMAQDLVELIVGQCKTMPQADELAAFLRASHALDPEVDLTVEVKEPVEQTLPTPDALVTTVRPIAKGQRHRAQASHSAFHVS